MRDKNKRLSKIVKIKHALTTEALKLITKKVRMCNKMQKYIRL